MFLVASPLPILCLIRPPASSGAYNDSGRVGLYSVGRTGESDAEECATVGAKFPLAMRAGRKRRLLTRNSVATGNSRLRDSRQGEFLGGKAKDLAF